jgi:hypothetical protein
MIPSLIFASILIFSPSEDYWQQDVSYKMDVELDTTEHTIKGIEEIIYKNNSPDTLKEIFIHLYPNAYKNRNSMFAKEMEKMGKYRFSFSKESERGWIEIDSLFIDDRKDSTSASIMEDKITEMRIDLKEPLSPNDSLKLGFYFYVKIPIFFSRLGHKKSHYEISQWYPKMVVYDDRGWHPDGYRAIGEFYGEFGRFDVSVTVPRNMVVGATGKLVESKTIEDGDLKLRYISENIHDFAFVCDPNYVVKEENYDGVNIRILYFENNGKLWRKAIDYSKDALRYYGMWYGKYPYKTLTVAQGYLGMGGGMEYPNLVIISIPPDRYTNFFETAVMHEVGHQWFYGMLGSNEMDETWLDEGINSFSEIRYMEEKYGSYEKLLRLPFPLDFLSPINDRYYHYFLYYIASHYEEKSVLTPAYEFVEDPVSYAGIAYSKAAFVVDMLKEYVGEEKFNKIMKTYVERFRYKHPHTEDFIQIVNEVTGEDMNWFFDQWLRTTEKCDYEITSVKCPHIDYYGEPKFLSLIHLRKNKNAVMPFELCLYFEDGNEDHIFMEGNFIDTTIRYKSNSRLKSIALDPDKKLLEMNRWNNYWPRKRSIKPLVDFPDFETYQIFYYPYVWYQSVDGLQVGGGLQGREFIPLENFYGRNSWDYHLVYGIKSGRFLHAGSYAFPVFKGCIVKTELGFNQAEKYQKVSLTKSSFNGILQKSEHKISLAYQHMWLGEYLYRTEKYWQKSNLYTLSLRYSFSRTSRLIEHYVEPELTYGMGDVNFIRLSVRASEFIRFDWNRGFTINLFGGYLWGTAIRQYKFYPSGSLFPTGASPLVLTYEGMFSPLEHWHNEGGPDLKGYYGSEIAGKGAISINFFSPHILRKKLFSTQIFFDAGTIFDDINTEKILMDGGVRFSLGPLFLDLPLWLNSPQLDEKRIDFRWCIGISSPSVSLF